MKKRIDYWYDRVDLSRKLMKQLQIPQITMTLDEREMKDLLDILGAFRTVLEQEPSGDLISRQAVMDCFKKWQPYMATRLWDFEQELSKLPPVNPQERTGHWIDTDEGFSPCECSECNRIQFRKSRYCPNCGCRMVEPQESEDV